MMNLNDTEFLRHAFRGDEDAVRLAKAIINIACVWDDLIDNDVAPNGVPGHSINLMMWQALVEIPLNPFYMKWKGVLQPLIQQSIINWHISNKMEEVPGRSREIAHVARYSAGDILIFMASIIDGVEWATHIGPEFKMRLQREGFADYDAEMEKKHPQAPKEAQ